MAGTSRYIKRLLVFALILMITGCASRMDKPEDRNGQLKIFKLKNGNSVVDNIQLCRKLDRDNDNLIGEGESFMIMDEGRIQAIVTMSDYILEKDKLSMFHFDWISSSGYTTYLKRVDYTPNDSSDYIWSSISITPELRTPGEYKLRIYYFRELIAEKEFELLPEFDPTLYNLEALKENLVVCKDIEKITGELSGVDSIFHQSETGSIWASFKLDNSFRVDLDELLYRFDWYEKGDMEAFYSKTLDVLIRDDISFISSSLSTSPEKRDTGEYLVVVNLFGKPIAQKEFVLLPPLDYSAINAKIILYKKNSKNSDLFIGEGTQFEIGKKNKVRAWVKVSGLDEFKGQELEFKLRWIGPDGKSVYNKNYNVTPEKSTEILKSAISIIPGKRKTGNYSLQVYLSGELIGEQKFKLLSGE
jgi:hypothetical protein